MKDKVKSKITPIICDMSGIYGRMYPDKARVDMTDISGTNAYCDDAAAAEIRERLTGPGGIRLIDSGNYHYLSFFSMERIERPFSLVLIDNHTDMQQPGFGRILSCGGWVKYAMDELLLLKRVYLFGVGEEHLAEVEPLPENVVVCRPAASPPADPTTAELATSDDESILAHSDSQIAAELPIFLSIDKDALTPEYAATDWDQGDMTEAGLFSIIENIKLHHTIIGVDICGEKKENPTEEDLLKNVRLNYKIIECVNR